MVSEKEVKIKVATEVDDDEVESLEAKLEEINGKSPLVNIDVEGEEELDETKEKVESLDGTEIDVNIDNQTALQAIDQISQGFSRLKQGALEIKDAFGEILSSAGAQEMNKTFLEMNLGPEKARAALSDISSIVNSLPGDDTALQGLLSQAAAKNAGITRQELEGMATAATDYFSAMSFYGKSATEAQQDMTNYILAGNTAELERSPILQGHIDKLKEGTTIQERSRLLQEALNEAGWGGISTQDTYNNKLETFNGMLERGRYNLGGLFQEGAKGAMDFALGLDSATNGAFGMGLALAEFASPLTDSVMGLGQMATGFKAIKDLGIISWFKELELVTKLSAAADWLLSAAQTVLNLVMSMNPVVLVVIALIALAAALIWAYQNVDWFREMIDELGASLMELVNTVLNSLITAFNDFAAMLGLSTESWIESVMAFILFIPQLPMRIGLALADALAKALGFKDGFRSAITNAATEAYIGFVNRIVAMYNKFREEVDRILAEGDRLARELPPKIAKAGLGVVGNWVISTGEHSPGKMYDAFSGELAAMESIAVNTSLPSLMGGVGGNVVGGFGSSNAGSFTSVGGDTIINIYGDVDSDKRVNEIVEVIRRELHWDNATAGRTV